MCRLLLSLPQYGSFIRIEELDRLRSRVHLPFDVQHSPPPVAGIMTVMTNARRLRTRNERMRLDLLQRMKLFRPHSVVGLPGRSVGLPGLWCLPLPRLNRWNVLCGSAPGDCGPFGSSHGQGHAAPAQRVGGGSRWLRASRGSQSVSTGSGLRKNEMNIRCRCDVPTSGMFKI